MPCQRRPSRPRRAHLRRPTKQPTRWSRPSTTRTVASSMTSSTCQLVRASKLTQAAGDTRGDGPLRILQKMTREANARFGSATVGSVTTLEPDRAAITINYARHAPDTFTAIKEGTWRIHLDI